MTVGAKIPVVDDKMKGRTLLSKAFTEMRALSAAVVHTAEENGRAICFPR